MHTASRRRALLSPLLLLPLLTACAQDKGELQHVPASALPEIAGGPTGARTSGDSGAATSPIPDLSGSPRLADLLRIALERSPVIQAAQARATAASESVAIEGWLPNPTVMIGWYETEVETRVGSQQWSVGIQQKIPFPTKLGTQTDIADSDAQRMRIVYERMTRDVLVEVVRVAHEIAYIDEAMGITGEIGAVLARYTTVAAAGETSSLVSELFRADTQRAQLENDRVILAELRFVEAQRMRSLLDLPTETPIGTPITDTLPDVQSSVAELLTIAEGHNQELREAGIALETARLRASLAGQVHIPDMSVGVTKIGTSRLPSSLGVDPSGNGDDPLILQFGLTLPIWVQKDAAVIRRSRSLERAAALERLDAIQRTRDRVARAWFQVGNADRLHRLYAEVLVPRAAIAARTAEDLLANGKGTLGGVLETIAVYHNFRLASARARADHGRAIAQLERAIGQPFDALAATPTGAATPTDASALPENETNTEEER